MSDNVKLKDLKKCKARVGDVIDRFEEIANALLTSDVIHDKDKCVAAANRITVELSEIREMLEQDIMIAELTT